MSVDTIFALATGSAKAGIAVIRVSGPHSFTTIKRLTGIENPIPRRATFVALRGAEGQILDQGLLLWFPRPASFTGEDIVEFHVHGGRAVIASVLEPLALIEGCRPAEPGEFTRRAFENGKLDLTAVEGLADLVAAETEAQRRQALAQMQGELGRLYEKWRERLLAAQARLEAEIDFSDQDLPNDLRPSVDREVREIEREIEGHLNDRNRGEKIRDGIRVAIIGAPNVGKSTLLNRIAQREVAIVTEFPGTTRDIIEVRLDLAGYPVLLSDTAGIRDATNAVEAEGVRRALSRAADADIVLMVFDATSYAPLEKETQRLGGGSAIPIINKVDLGARTAWDTINGIKAEVISAKTGAGVDQLLERLTREIIASLVCAGPPALTRTRHRRALEGCVAALSRFINVGEAELAAEELRIAARCLGRITGRVDVDAVLDAIFRDFCIGK